MVGVHLRCKGQQYHPSRFAFYYAGAPEYSLGYMHADRKINSRQRSSGIRAWNAPWSKVPVQAGFAPPARHPVTWLIRDSIVILRLNGKVFHYKPREFQLILFDIPEHFDNPRTLLIVFPQGSLPCIGSSCSNTRKL